MIKVLTFSAEWCMPCKMLAPLLKKLQSEHSGIEFQKIDIQSDKVTTQLYGVNAVPTVVILKNDSVVHTIIGPNEKRLRQAIQSSL